MIVSGTRGGGQLNLLKENGRLESEIATLRTQLAAAEERAINLQTRLNALTETYGVSCRAARADAVREFAKWLGSRYDGDEPYSGYAASYLTALADVEEWKRIESAAKDVLKKVQP
jgi:hypothetical protein